MAIINFENMKATEPDRNFDNANVDENYNIGLQNGQGFYGASKFFGLVQKAVNWISTITGNKNFTGTLSVNSKEVATTESVNNALANYSKSYRFTDNNKFSHFKVTFKKYYSGTVLVLFGRTGTIGEVSLTSEDSTITVRYHDISGSESTRNQTYIYYKVNSYSEIEFYVKTYGYKTSTPITNLNEESCILTFIDVVESVPQSSDIKKLDIVGNVNETNLNNALANYQSKNYLVNLTDANQATSNGILNSYRVSQSCLNLPKKTGENYSRIGILTVYGYVSGQYYRTTQEYITNDDNKNVEKYIREGFSNNNGTTWTWGDWQKLTTETDLNKAIINLGLRTDANTAESIPTENGVSLKYFRATENVPISGYGWFIESKITKDGTSVLGSQMATRNGGVPLTYIRSVSLSNGALTYGKWRKVTIDES